MLLFSAKDLRNSIYSSIADMTLVRAKLGNKQQVKLRSYSASAEKISLIFSGAIATGADSHLAPLPFRRAANSMS